MTARGWTWTREPEPFDASDRAELGLEPLSEAEEQAAATKRAQVELLAGEWNELHTAEERDEWKRLAALEDPDLVREPEGEAEAIAWRARRQAQARIRRDRIRAIERELAELGARIMRPYEHWNEDERLMQYLESDRFEEYAY